MSALRLYTATTITTINSTTTTIIIGDGSYGNIKESYTATTTHFDYAVEFYGES